MNDDLWPADMTTMLTAGIPDAPVSILRKQAAALAGHTGNRIRGEVRPLNTSDKTVFVYSFDLFVPGLNYRYELFVICYGVEGYPIFVAANQATTKSIELGKVHTSVFGASRMAVSARSEEEFRLALRCIFAHESTNSTLRLLLSQLAAESPKS